MYGVGAMGSIIARLLLEKGVTVGGAIARSPTKVGRDLGEVADLGFRTGVIVESDPRVALSRRAPDIAVVAVGSYVQSMYEHFKLCLEHGVNVVTLEEESFYPWVTAPGLAAELDRIGKENDATITGSGQQDVYWTSMISLLMAAAHRVDIVQGRTTWNVDDYGPAVAAEVYAGETHEAFKGFVAENARASLVVENALGALIAEVGLTAKQLQPETIPILAETETRCDALGRSIRPGELLGVADAVTADTIEGTSFTFEMRGYVYRPDEVDVNEWVVRGDPAELRLFNDRIPTGLTSCVQVVNRIPDVINAPPGFITVDFLPRISYRPRPLGDYVV